MQWSWTAGLTPDVYKNTIADTHVFVLPIHNMKKYFTVYKEKMII